MRLVFIAGIAFAGLILADHGSRVMGAQPLDGKAIFLLNCAVCHQATGRGGGPFPPLAGNPDVNQVDSAALIQTVLNGRTGPITVNGAQYGGNMPVLARPAFECGDRRGAYVRSNGMAEQRARGL